MPTLEETMREIQQKLDRLERKLVSDDGPVDDVANLHSVTWTHYVIGYERAAHQLFEGMHQNGHMQNFLCFPIVFLFRHYIELELKRLTAMAQVARNGRADRIPVDHDLIRLWTRFESETREFDDYSNQSALVCERIRELSSIDSRSESFRYPIEKRGAPVFSTIERINVRNLAEIMEAISMYFDGWDGYLDDMISNIPDYESY